MKKFIDEVYFQVKAGDGGAGIVSFDRFKYQPIGKPAGGDGGRGGHVFLRVDSNLSDLSHLKQVSQIRAHSGQAGGANKRSGKDGEDVSVLVPPGVLIREFGTQKVLKELLQQGEEYLLCRGGKGGLGNTHFKSSTNRSPRTALKGEKGEGMKIILELKLLADVGLVGFPNAGKSTLLGALTEARPQIADYPFTTLSPNLGIFYDEEGHAFRIADIPGLIEGSSQGKGLGIQFLRHITRTRVLCVILDLSELDFKKKLEILLAELKRYDPDLLKKEVVLAGNKMDLLDPKKIPKGLRKRFILISALRSENLDQLKKKLLDKLRKGRTTPH